MSWARPYGSKREVAFLWPAMFNLALLCGVLLLFFFFFVVF